MKNAVHLHLVIWQTLLSKATYNWGVHKVHMKNAVLINISFSIETIKYIFPELFCDKNGKRVFVVAFINQS